MSKTLASRTREAAPPEKAAFVYGLVRVLAVVSILFLFIPTLNPAHVSGLINKNMSLFTSGVAYNQLADGFGRAVRRGMVAQGSVTLLMIGSLVCCLGVIALCAGMCAALGSYRLKRIGAGAGAAGGAAGLLGLALVFVSYSQLAASPAPETIEAVLPVSFFVLLAILGAAALLCAGILITGPKSHKGDELSIQPRYQLFLMCLPFLLLCFLFGYLPLYGWRYAFFDYSAGDVLSMENFVGFKWFTYLFENEATRNDIVQVMKNTLGISGLGLATSWCSMAFAVFLAEIKNDKYRRIVQTFTTIPNFISWVLIFAVATAIFSTDGFISNLMVGSGIWESGQNMLVNNSHVWLQMLAWSLWKGLGWGAIVYIAAISGIDQSLYEAAKVDGAGRFARMWHVTIPELMPTYCVMLLMAVANILNNGMEQYLVFENSANTATIQVLDLYVYKLGIGSGLIPLSTAIGMLKSVVSVTLLFAANKISQKARGESMI